MSFIIKSDIIRLTWGLNGVLVSSINGFKLNFVNPLSKNNQSLKSKTDLYENHNITFGGSATSAGNPLKKLANVPDPFFGITLINSPQMTKILKDLESCSTIKKAVKYLKKYKPYMQETELAIFEKFEASAPTSPRMQFQDLLKQWYNDAIIKLKLEEFRILDDIDKTSQCLTPETELNIRAKTTACRTIILNNNPDNTFKRKDLLNSLEEISIKPEENEILEEIKDKADYLPSSATSENAFIVKYSDRSHEEIAKRLIRTSELTIDHILAKSKGGDNDISNFVPASVKANSLKGNSTLEKFLKRFPQIQINFQKYIDFIINIMNKNGLLNHPLYPYNIKKTVYNESNGKIKLNVSKYKYSKNEAGKIAKKLEKKLKK